MFINEKQALCNNLRTEVEFFLFLMEQTQDVARIRIVRQGLHKLCDRLDEIEAQEQRAA